MGAAAAAALGVPVEEVLMSSTGIIGIQLPIEHIEAGLQGIAAELQDDPLKGVEGMMTTDSYPKATSLSVGDVIISVVGKGSGMIAPNLATMLVYIFTDAEFSAPALDRMLRAAVADSFNMLSIDTDTSTSDTCAIMANGLAGPIDEEVFFPALKAACIRMTEMLARDGEGASKLLRATVQGARTQEEARTIARSIINSPLVKTMAYGADPNIGRVLMAVGKCFDCAVEPEKIVVWINDTLVFERGLKAAYDEMRLRELLSGDPVDIRVDLQLGPGTATAYGCDLTQGYIEENAAYYSS